MDEWIWYFAYGSNMKEARLTGRDVRLQAHKIGYINNYTFRYNKIGIDDTAKGNIISREGHRVWGVFFRVPAEDYLHLHLTYEKGYRQLEVEGISNRRPVPAKSFIASPENINEALLPDKGYHETVIQGAREKKLPEDYIRKLRVL